MSVHRVEGSIAGTPPEPMLPDFVTPRVGLLAQRIFPSQGKNIWTQLETSLINSKPMTNLKKLNLGCGADIMAGYVNVDHPNTKTPKDVPCDLNVLPWPFADNSVDEVWMNSTLEHLHEPETKVQEVHRILKPGGVFHGNVPYFRYDGAVFSMDHRWFFTERSFDIFCADENGNSRCCYLFAKPLFKMEYVRLVAGAHSWRERARNLIPFRSILTYFLNNMYDGITFKLIKI